MKLSVVVPAYNEETGFPRFLPSLIDSVEKAVGKSYEIIVVNDGSTDSTLKVLKNLSKNNTRLRVVNLSRNFGKEIAITAGIFQCSGDAIVMIDADGQHPPELISKMLKKWEKGSQVVIGVRTKNHKEGFVKKYGSKIFYKVMNYMSNNTIIPGSTDYRLIDRSVGEEFIGFTERYRITRGLIDWMGFQRSYIEFEANPRLYGEASYKFNKLFKLALNSFVSLSMTPLYIIGYVGIGITSISFVVGLFILIEQVILNDPLRMKFTGSAMLSILILFLVGITLIAQGLISIYLSHIHVQTQNRPLFIIDKKNSYNLKRNVEEV